MSVIGQRVMVEITYGDEVVMQHLIDTDIRDESYQTLQRDSDHVQMDIMYQVTEN